MMLDIQNSSILLIKTDVIVLSANSSLLAGSGISGIIHKAAGPELEKAAKPLGPLKPGQAVITPGFNLSAKYVIHTVCPRYMDGMRGERELLSAAYANALAFYNQVPEARSIAFVSMGTGIYKWPLALAAEIAVQELLKSQFEKTYMCVIDKATRLVYQSALDRFIESEG